MPTVPPEYFLDLSEYGDIPEDKLDEVGEAVGEYVRDEILAYVQSGDSPVKGERFTQLSEEYAEETHGGDQEPRLEDTGDMLNAVSYETFGGVVRIYIDGDFENDKASGHNQFPGGEHPTLPRRRFIPYRDQKFKDEIEGTIREIVSGYAVDEEQESTTFEDLTEEQEQQARGLLASLAGLFGE